MKIFILILVSSMSFSAFANAGADSQRLAQNARIEKCMKSVAAFFRNTRWASDLYYNGENKKGRCFIGYTPLPNFQGMNIFINSKEANLIGSIEISSNGPINPTGISSDIQQCDVTGKAITLRNKYRMPRSFSIMSDGSIRRSLSIFDVVERQSLQIVKNADGTLVSAKFQTHAGTQTCNF